MSDEQDWTPLDGVTEPDEVREMSDTSLVPELTHPVRGTIIRRLKAPRTVAQLAESLDVPITRLYHHVNRLEELGMIRVVATRRVGAVTERRYQSTALGYRFAPEFFETVEPKDLAMALGSLFDVAKVGLQRGVESGLFTGQLPEEEKMAISLGEFRMTEPRRVELLSQIQSLLEDFGSDADDDDPDAVRMTLFIAAYPDR